MPSVNPEALSALAKLAGLSRRDIKKLSEANERPDEESKPKGHGALAQPRVVLPEV